MAKGKKKNNGNEMSSEMLAAISGIETAYGDGSIVYDDKPANIERIDSGSIGLDIALGGGYAKGRIIEIYGQESAGKSSLAIHAMVGMQKLGKSVVFLDFEHAFDKSYAKSVGLDVSPSKFLISQPDNGEMGFDIAERMFDVAEVGMIVFDSVSAMTPKAEIEGEFGESKMGLQARMMSQAFRKITVKAAKSDTTLIFINQLREKIGVMFGNPITTTGGNALKFYASQRLDIAKIQNKSTDSNGDRMLNDIRVKVVKNKTAPPFREANFKIRFGTGIDRLSEIIEYAVDVDLLQRKGAWFSYDGTNIGQGLEKTRNALIDNPELSEEIETKLLEILKDI